MQKLEYAYLYEVSAEEKYSGATKFFLAVMESGRIFLLQNENDEYVWGLTGYNALGSQGWIIPEGRYGYAPDRKKSGIIFDLVKQAVPAYGGPDEIKIHQTLFIRRLIDADS